MQELIHRKKCLLADDPNVEAEDPNGDKICNGDDDKVGDDEEWKTGKANGNWDDPQTGTVSRRRPL